jgi:hypothetical protein
MSKTTIYNQLEFFSQKHNLKFLKEVNSFPLGKREELRLLDGNDKTLLFISFKQSASASVINKLYVVKTSFKIANEIDVFTISKRGMIKRLESFLSIKGFSPFEVVGPSSNSEFYKEVRNEMANYSAIDQVSDIILKVDSGSFSIQARILYENQMNETLDFILKLLSKFRK